MQQNGGVREHEFFDDLPAAFAKLDGGERDGQLAGGVHAAGEVRAVFVLQGDELLRVGQEDPAVVAEHRAPRAHEQRRADLQLQGLEMLGQRRQGNVQLRGGLLQLLGAGGDDELAQILEFHGSIISSAVE